MILEKSLTIKAPPAHVWDILIDVERWPEWTASTLSVERLDGGELGPGSRVRIKQPRLPRVVWTVTELLPGERFRWVYQSPGATTLADHELRARSDGGTELKLRLTQTGLLARLMAPFYTKMTIRYLKMEAEGLKARSEMA